MDELSQPVLPHQFPLRNGEARAGGEAQSCAAVRHLKIPLLCGILKAGKRRLEWTFDASATPAQAETQSRFAAPPALQPHVKLNRLTMKNLHLKTAFSRQSQSRSIKDKTYGIIGL